MKTVAFCLLLAGFAILAGNAAPDGPWTRHTIDQSSQGADGVRLADANHDGLLDIATGWEEEGVIRVYLNPGPHHVQNPWPAVTVGQVNSPEDAVLVDLDGDGRMDVVSCCEGETKTVWVHWAPQDASAYLSPSAWVTQPFPVTQGARQWMYSLPLEFDHQHGVDLVLGSKNQDGAVGWLEAPENPRDVSAWTWHPLCPAGWIMSLDSLDLDGDGDTDVIFSDRKGERRGCYWFENPGSAAAAISWNLHPIGGFNSEVMFLSEADLDHDGRWTVAAATYLHEILLFHRADALYRRWNPLSIPIPQEAGIGKAVQMVDVDLDGRMDLVFTCEKAEGRSGVMWLSPPPANETDWQPHDIAGPEGIKYDRLELLDLDGDGDLDIITCEERTNLGVIWYENPTRHPSTKE